MGSLRFGRITVKTSNPDKVFFPQDGITKGDLVEHYVAVADRMLPHLRGRPLSFQRFPDGIDGEGFFQKSAPKHYPSWIQTTAVKKKGGENQHVVAHTKATLAFLANNGVVTMHGALSRAPQLHKPDRLIFDLDPSVEDFEVVVRGAHTVREVLDDLGLPTYLQTSGSRGLHVVTPLRQSHDFDFVGEVGARVAARVVERDPDSFTVEFLKEDRGDRLLIDHFRNRYAQTAVVPYSIRALPGAPVATPIDWDELGALGKGARTFDIGNIRARLAADVDPWADMARRARTLTRAAQRLGVDA